MNRPSYCGAVTIQCSIGERYRFADTDFRSVRVRVDVEIVFAAARQAQDAREERSRYMASIHRRVLRSSHLKPKLIPRGIGKSP